MDVKLFAFFANDEDEGLGRDRSKIGMLTDENGVRRDANHYGNDSCQRSGGVASTHFSNLSLLGTWAASARVAGMVYMSRLGLPTTR